MIHHNPSKLAGKTVRIKKWVHHPQFSDFGGSEVVIEDWWDRITGKSWKDSNSNPTCLIYAIRTAFSDFPIPNDDEVLYAKYKGLGVLVHISEIECP